jgi:hypothetical protein
MIFRGIYKSANPTLTNNQYHELMLDSSGNLNVNIAATGGSSGVVSLFSNLGANATLNVKASSGKVYSLTCHNENASDRWIQLHNTATVPATGVTVPILSFLVPFNSQLIVGEDFFGSNGIQFATGIAFAFSTTKDVYTAATATDHSTHVRYE